MGKVFLRIAITDKLIPPYKSLGEQANNIKNEIKNKCNIKELYCPEEQIKSLDNIENQIVDDFEYLKESDYIIFIYPEKVLPSVLMEIGFAIAYQKKTLLFVNTVDELPFLIRKYCFPNLKIYTFKDINDIIDRIKRENEL